MPVEPPIVTPRTLGEAYVVMAGEPHRPIAGGTDLMVALTGELGEPPDRMIDLWRLDELRGIELDGDAIVLGALTTWTEIRRSSLCTELLPTLVEAAATIGAAQIQNRGTLGGNIFVAGSARGEREIAAADFWVAYRTTALQPDELLVRVIIPIAPGREIRFRKVGTRRAQAISKVVMALAWNDGTSQVGWRDVRVALGSVADRPIRAHATEAVREGATPIPAQADLAAESRSTTSARPQSIGGSSPRGSSIG
jgi:CO/xanthine dehydrogenase FAD-binding subunit